MACSIILGFIFGIILRRGNFGWYKKVTENVSCFVPEGEGFGIISSLKHNRSFAFEAGASTHGRVEGWNDKENEVFRRVVFWAKGKA
jgi:hypothetical protein